MAKPITVSKELLKRYESMERKRDYAELSPRKYYLIVCEGEKTEPNYFKSLKQDLPKGVIDIDILGIGANTLTIVKKAKELYKKSLRTTRPYDSVWLVFDRDSFPADRFDNAIYSARAQNFKCAWSNEAFELWYLLHFEYRNTAMSRDDYKSCLSSYLGREYKKNDEDMYHDIKGNIKHAIRNATKLLQQHKAVAPSASNPGTRMHLLIKELSVFMK